MKTMKKDPFLQHPQAGKDYGMVFYGGRIGGIPFRPCYALLRHLGPEPWIRKAKALGAYAVQVWYTRSGARELVYSSDKWTRNWQEVKP